MSGPRLNEAPKTHRPNPKPGTEQGSSRGVSDDPNAPNLGAGQRGGPHETGKKGAPIATGDDRTNDRAPTRGAPRS